jgi:Ser/Thr protein kinase RdoA (MazF antagonist)
MEQETQDLLAALEEKATRALVLWGLPAQKPELLKYRENAVYRVRLANDKSAALRLHRPGYHNVETIRSELSFSAHLAQGGLNVPLPFETAEGETLVNVAAPGAPVHYASIVSWTPGAPIGQSGEPFAHDESALADIFDKLGTTLAKLHDLADGFGKPGGFSRPAWDRAGLLGEAPFWGRFWDCDGLSADQKISLSELRARLKERLDATSCQTLDFGLIHADAVRENVMLDGKSLGLIDFDDCGFGYRLFDLATPLLKSLNEPAYPLIKAAPIGGYRARRPLPEAALEMLPLFLLLRSLTYIGWAAQRPEAAHKVGRYADEALKLAAAL